MKFFLMKFDFDESGSDESGFDEIDHFHPNFDESEPNRTGPLCWTWAIGEFGWIVVAVSPHACFRAFLMLLCARILL